MAASHRIAALLLGLGTFTASLPVHAAEPVACTSNKGSMLKCGGEVIWDIWVSRGSRGGYSRISWKQYFSDDLKQWRSIALYDTGQAHFVVDPGKSNASKWWTFSHWIFPRKQGLSIAKYPGEFRFRVTDATGLPWELVGRRLSQTRASLVVERIGEAEQGEIEPTKTERGVMGVDLDTAGVFYLQHHRPDFKAYTNYQAPRYLRMKSTFHDQSGGRCRVPNREIFDPMPNPKDVTDHLFKLDTDGKLLALLSKRCANLDLAPLEAVVPTPSAKGEASDLTRAGGVLLGSSLRKQGMDRDSAAHPLPSAR